MVFDEYRAQDRRRAARHEAGHWLSYLKYGFEAGGIQIGPVQFAAEVKVPHVDTDAAGYSDFLKNRMRTVVAGFVAEAVPDAAGAAPGYLLATEWKAYPHLKADYERFDDLLAQLEQVAPAPAGQNPRDHYVQIFRDEVRAFLQSVPEALDAIQAAVLESKADHIDFATLAALPAVRAVIDGVDKEREAAACPGAGGGP